MTSPINWQNLRHEILRHLDIKKEYADLGVEITGTNPSHSGWIECRTYGRADRTPSAGVNVNGEAGWHGRYKEFNGNGHSMLLFDFAVEVAKKFPTFHEAIKHYAEKSGVQMPKGRRPEGPESKLDFRQWNEALVKNWCRIKHGITPQAVSISGAKMAQWPKKTGQFTVIAFPFYGENLIDSDPTGWAVCSVTGQPIPIPQGDGLPPKLRKVMTVSGSVSGFIGRYGLSILHKPDLELVWKVEGIPDMLALQSAILKFHTPCPICFGNVAGCESCYKGRVYPYIRKHAVFTNAGGAMEFPTKLFLNNLVGKNVNVIGDADKPGEAGAIRWYRELSTVTATCNHVRLPYQIVEDHGPDLRDWLNEGHDYGDLLKLTESQRLPVVVVEEDMYGLPVTKPAVPEVGAPGSKIVVTTTPEITSTRSPRTRADTSETLANERRICEVLQIQVVGEDDDMGIEVFSLRHGKSTTLKRISFLTFEELLQVCGENIREFINTNPHQEIPGAYRMSQIKQAIAAIAGYQRASKESKFGLGCWWALDAARQKRDAIVVVGGHEGFEWDVNAHTTRRLQQPIWGGMVLDFKNEDTWYDYDLLAGYLHKANDPAWGLKAVEEAISLFSKWNWKYPEHTPAVIAGLVLASWVQTLWYWRPMVALTGPSHAGKTTLFETLDHIFGPLAMRSAKSSEAGLRQGMGNNAYVLLADEFENDGQRQKILDLLRTSSKGDKMFKGTTNQEGQTFGLRHICWVAAIEVGLKREPDKNRFIQLELKRHDSRTHGKMDWMPAPHELADLGMKLLAVAIRNVHRAIQISDVLRSHKQEGVHGRIIESYSVPVAMLATVTGNTEDVARAMLQKILSEIEFEGVTSADEHELMGAILSSTVDLGTQGRPSVGQCLEFPGRWLIDAASQGLEKSGVGRVTASIRDTTGTHKVDCLFLVPSVVCRVLLRDTAWKDQDISQILKRVTSAQMARHRIAGQLSSGVRIPWRIVTELFLGDKDTPNDGNVSQNAIDFN